MWILCSILAVLLFLLLLPVSLEASYDNELSLRVRYFFFKWTIFPAKEEAEEEKSPQKSKKSKKEPAKEETKKEKKPSLDSLLEILELVKQALSSLRNPLGYFLRHIRYRDIWLHILVAKEDAHQTALRYGECQAAVHSALALLKNCADIKIADIQIQADFIGEEEKFSGGGSIKIRPIHGLIFGFWFMGSFGIGYLRRKWTEAKGNKELKKQVDNK